MLIFISVFPNLISAHQYSISGIQYFISVFTDSISIHKTAIATASTSIYVSTNDIEAETISIAIPTDAIAAISSVISESSNDIATGGTSIYKSSNDISGDWSSISKQWNGIVAYDKRVYTIKTVITNYKKKCHPVLFQFKRMASFFKVNAGLSIFQPRICKHKWNNTPDPGSGWLTGTQVCSDCRGNAGFRDKKHRDKHTFCLCPHLFRS